MNFFLSARWPVRLALLIIALLAIIALTSQWWLPYDPQAIDLPSRLLSPDSQHWLGTDHLGRDIFSRLLAATRVSLGSVIACLLLVLALGLIVGGSAGLMGGRVDQFTMRVADIFMTFPTSILSFFLVGVLGTGLTNVIIAIALSHWAWYARMIRTGVMQYRDRNFVRFSRCIGTPESFILFRHLVPSIAADLAVLSSLDVGWAIINISTLSFLGLGVQAPTPEWGAMLSEAKNVLTSNPTQMIVPGVAIVILVSAFNLMGDALRDVLDPKEVNV